MRSILGVATALALMAVVALVFFLPLSLIMGPERALDTGSSTFNNLWVGITMVVSLTAACVGGWMVHRVSGSLGAVIALGIAVTMLGLADAAWHQWLMPLRLLAEMPRTGYEMLLIAREPLWYDLTLPILMAVFIWVAGASRAVEYPEEA